MMAKLFSGSNNNLKRLSSSCDSNSSSFSCFDPFGVFDAFPYSATDLFSELLDDCDNQTIESDCAKINADDVNCISIFQSEGDFDDLDIKPEIRNSNCMWSAGCNSNHNNNNNNVNAMNGIDSAASSYNESTAVPPAITMVIKPDPDAVATKNSDSNNSTITVVANKNKTLAQQQMFVTAAVAAAEASKQQHQVKEEVLDDVVEQHIPPGASLLRKSNNSNGGNHINMQKKKAQQQQQQAQQQRQLISNNNFGRPDTPHSLYDEGAPDFRHSVDLRACVMGSNNISLTSAGDANYIDHLSRELQNTSKQRIDLPFRISVVPAINDVIDVLSQQSGVATSGIDNANNATATAKTNSKATRRSGVSSDCESDDGEGSLVDSGCGSADSLDGNNHLYLRHISDHSYTRCNDMGDARPPETPSDSDEEEEIDVVSVNDKKNFPANPSDKDRRALQTKMEHKFSVMPHIERGLLYQYLPCTPANSSPEKTPVHVPKHIDFDYYKPNGDSNSSENKSSRKRHYMQLIGGNNVSAANRSLETTSLSKKYRGKKSTANGTQHSNSMASNLSSSSSSSSSGSSGSENNVTLKRHFSMDEADTIEKRNLHNDMERQRRIGLKNLFEALKKEIPSIKDKERAPKVNILREAAKLCEQLTEQAHKLSVQQQLLREQQKKRQELLARLRAARSQE